MNIKTIKMNQHILALIIGLSFTLNLAAQTPDYTELEPTRKTFSEPNDATPFHEYCGQYQLNENPYLDAVSFNVKDGNLIASATHYNDIMLEPTDKDIFYAPHYHAKVIFIRKESVITGLRISALSLRITGEKL